MRIPKPGQILLVTSRMGTPKRRVYSRYITYVLRTEKNYNEKSIATCRVIATDYMDGLPLEAIISPVPDFLHEIDINYLKAHGDKVELVGIQYLPKCISWNRGITYERILKREPLDIGHCDDCHNFYEFKKIQTWKWLRLCPTCLAKREDTCP